MKFGVCTTLDNAPVFAKAGYNFIELTVAGDLRPEDPHQSVEAMLERIQASSIPAKAANCFVPGHIKLVGEEVNSELVERYVSEAFERAHEAGISTIVFGSGAARRIPEGFSRSTAYAQLLEFGKAIAPIAQSNNLTIVMEPLNSSETNMINTMAEGAAYVQAVNHPAMRLLVDAFHWAREHDSARDLSENGSLIAHAHIATYTSRCAPGIEECDFFPFFAALKAGGFNGTLSIEGSWSNPSLQARQALSLLESAIEK
jgi:sugar phosphate isomerase/epimerase